MQSIRQCARRLASCTALAANKLDFLSGALKTTYILPSHNIHQASVNYATGFLEYNKTIFPPQKPGEEKRPAYVCSVKKNIKYSPKKMWYIACLVRGMSVDEAIKQLSFLKQKGAAIAKDVIKEAQDLAVEGHNVEYKSNLWVAESFVTKGVTIKGMRRHAKGRQGIIHYRHSNYYVRLEEGKPPKHYYLPAPKSGEELLADWMKQMHSRKIPNSL